VEAAEPDCKAVKQACKVVEERKEKKRSSFAKQESPELEVSCDEDLELTYIISSENEDDCSRGVGNSKDINSEESLLEESRLMESSSRQEDISFKDSQNTILELVNDRKDFIALDVLIQMEYCSGKSLKDHINHQNKLG
jgi:serine/threonine protein kinase